MAVVAAAEEAGTEGAVAVASAAAEEVGKVVAVAGSAVATGEPSVAEGSTVAGADPLWTALRYFQQLRPRNGRRRAVDRAITAPERRLLTVMGVAAVHEGLPLNSRSNRREG